MSTTLAKPVSRPWRRFLRFSMRGMIVFVLVSGIGLAWMVRAIRSAQIQRDAVVAIENAGGVVRYDWEWPAGEPWAPQWLVDLVGVPYFGNVIVVEFYSSSTTADATVAQVGRLTELRDLDLHLLNVSDADLAHLKGLTKLSQLYLSATGATEAGVREIQRALPRLKINRDVVHPHHGCE